MEKGSQVQASVRKDTHVTKWDMYLDGALGKTAASDLCFQRDVNAVEETECEEQETMIKKSCCDLQRRIRLPSDSQLTWDLSISLPPCPRPQLLGEGADIATAAVSVKT